MAKTLAREAMQPVLDLRDHTSFRERKSGWFKPFMRPARKIRPSFISVLAWATMFWNPARRPSPAGSAQTWRATRAIQLPRPKRQSRTIKKPLAMRGAGRAVGLLLRALQGFPRILQRR